MVPWRLSPANKQGGRGVSREDASKLGFCRLCCGEIAGTRVLSADWISEATFLIWSAFISKQDGRFLSLKSRLVRKDFYF